MRTFLSYDITEPSVISKISTLQNELKSTGADIKLVDPSILHFTVRFLGETDQEKSEQIIKALEENAQFSQEQHATFTGIGTFPDEKRISVIWIGCDQGSRKDLTEKANSINSHLDSKISGLKRADGFSPHVTIARVRSARNKDKLIEFLDKHRSEEFGSANIGTLRLKLSELYPGGPAYSDLHVFGKAS